MENRDPTHGSTTSRLAALIVAALLPLAAGACDDDASLMPPQPTTGGDLFERYVALGNSITAGFQSGGINDSTQRRSYAVLLAERMGTRFEIPALARPGCPPPLTNVFTGETVGGPQAPACSFRVRPVPRVLSNVAVPGAAVIDALSNLDPTSNANTLTTVMLGGRTQIQAAARAEPTFASVWLGNNDVLGAALTGNTALITPIQTFAQRYTAALDSLESAAGEEDLEGVLVGVANVTLAPFLSPGAAYFQAEAQGALPPTFEVADNCAPSSLGGVGETTFVPFTYGIGVMLNLASAGQQVELDCTDNRDIEEIVGPQAVPDDIEGTSLLVSPETGQVVGTVQAYNQAIQAEAQARDWAFFNPNPLFTNQLQQGQIPLFPNVTGPEAVTRPFGPLFSKDGVHPSTEAHRILAGAIADAVNAQYDTDLTGPEGGS